MKTAKKQNTEDRLGIPGNKGTWPKLKRNTGTSGLIRGSGTLIPIITLFLRFIGLRGTAKKQNTPSNSMVCGMYYVRCGDKQIVFF